MRTETLSIRISKAERQALRERAQREGVSQGCLVRRALRAAGVTREPAVRSDKPAYERIKHLLGKNRGKSKNLSTDPEQMEGYGR